MNARGGIDLGGTKIQAVVVDERNKVRGAARAPTPTSGGPPAVVAALAETLDRAATEAGLATGDLAGVGVGSPGEVDERRGTVAQARNLPDWLAPFPLAPELAAATGVPAAVGNDVRVATDAEYRLGAGRPYRSLLGVFWGTGVGGGLVLDGEPWLGRGAAGELGHMVVKRGGARCTCGRRGCVEAYAGRQAMELTARRRHAKGMKTQLFKIMEERGRDRLSSGVWARALASGDKLAQRLIARAIDHLAAGIASAVNLLDVEAVVLGGGLGTRLGPDYVGDLTAAMHPHLFVDARPPAMHIAALGDLGGALGAALLAEGSSLLGSPVRAGRASAGRQRKPASRRRAATRRR